MECERRVNLIALVEDLLAYQLRAEEGMLILIATVVIM